MRYNKNSDRQLIGTIYSAGAPQVAEMITLAGFDWVMIDMEHSALSLGDTQNALQVLGEGILRIVRVPGNDEIWIKRVLDTGCDGIIIPMVNSAEEAEKIISASKYPLEGNRSVGVARAHKYGAEFKEYVTDANSDLIIMPQIEHIKGVMNIDSILKVNGIDAIFIGPYDLSASMGLTGQVNHPEVRAAIDLIKSKCRETGLPYAIFGASPEAMEQEFRDGCRFLVCGVDLMILSEALRVMLDRLRLLRKIT
ncbi:MAG: aldolase/citrate lyase family protein [Bacteroidales bacterium]